MKLPSFLLSALLGSVAASPIDPATPSSSPNLTPRALPDWGLNIHNDYTFQSDPNYLGWIIRLSNTYQFRFPSSTWTIPTDIDSAYWLAYTFANTLSTWNHSNRVSLQPIGGGWCVDASVSQAQGGWTYAMIPTKLAADWVLGHAADYINWGSPGPRNAFQNVWLSSDNRELYYFRLSPCQRDASTTDKLVIFEGGGKAPRVV
ncbi:hypothetical protein V8F20_005788 [Naviculisporaceae sp. PSN 640]